MAIDAIVGPFFVHSQITDFGRNVATWVLRRSTYPQQKDAVLQHTDDGQLLWTEIEEGGVMPPPTFTIPRAAGKLLLESFQETLGIKPPEESLMQGRMDAMSLHLADMRRLVFEEFEIAKKE
jgi:hypothetical protein